MKIKELLDSLPDLERERLLGRIEGMTMAMRICRNRSNDSMAGIEHMIDGDSIIVQRRKALEAETCAALIRMVQVNIGNGMQAFGELSPAEQDEIWRIF